MIEFSLRMNIEGVIIYCINQFERIKARPAFKLDDNDNNVLKKVKQMLTL